MMHRLTHCLHPPTHHPLQANATCILKATRVHPKFLLDQEARQKSCSFNGINRCPSHFRSLEQQRTQQSPLENHHPSLRVSPLGLMKWLQRSNQAVLRLRKLSPIGHTPEGFVDLGHGPKIGVPTSSNSHTPLSTTTRTFTTLWSNHSSLSTTDSISTTTSLRLTA